MLKEGVGNQLSDESGEFKGEVNRSRSSRSTPLDLVGVILVLKLVAVSHEGNALDNQDASKSDNVSPHYTGGDVGKDNVHDGYGNEGHSPEDQADGPDREVSENTDELRNTPPGTESFDADVVSDDEVPVELVGVVDEVGHAHHAVTKPRKRPGINQSSKGIVHSVVRVLKL